jgi:hypothetical protein
MVFIPIPLMMIREEPKAQSDTAIGAPAHETGALLDRPHLGPCAFDRRPPRTHQLTTCWRGAPSNDKSDVDAKPGHQIRRSYLQKLKRENGRAFNAAVEHNRLFRVPPAVERCGPRLSDRPERAPFSTVLPLYDVRSFL